VKGEEEEMKKLRKGRKMDRKADEYADEKRMKTPTLYLNIGGEEEKIRRTRLGGRKRNPMTEKRLKSMRA